MLPQLLRRNQQKRWQAKAAASEVQAQEMHTTSSRYAQSPLQDATRSQRRAGPGHYERPTGDRQPLPFITLDQVVKVYEANANAFVALKQINLQVARGEFVAVIGKSGSGKSTLINMLTGIDRPTAGRVLVADVAVHELTESQVAIWRGRNVGVIFQFFQLLPTLTVLENVMLPMDFCNVIPYRQRKARALALLDQVGMAEQVHKLPTAISGGQQQRVAIARALANDPPLIVADEPTGNLDSHTADTVFQLFETLVAAKKTILVVTHDMELAMRMKRIVIIADGRIVEDRTHEGQDRVHLPAAVHTFAERNSDEEGAPLPPATSAPSSLHNPPSRQEALHV